ASPSAHAPAIDVINPPGVSEGRGRFGRPLGGAEMPEPDTAPGEQQNLPLSGRPGPSVSRAPVGGLNPPAQLLREQEPGRLRPQVLEPASVPQYGELDLPGAAQPPRPPGNLTLDGAIDLLLRRNLNLLALQHEIPMAQADVLTASLRANPAFYADTQLQPYGHYTRANPGGPPQYDVNLTYPLDVSHKRRARTVVAEKAKQVTEAQFQDAVRILIDNLYTAYVDVVAAEETLRYSRRSLEGLTQLFNLRRELFDRGQVREAEVEALRSQAGQARLQVRAAEQALERTTRTLARLMNVPRFEVASIRVQDPLRDARELPQAAD